MTGLQEGLFIALIVSCVLVGIGSLYYVMWFALAWRSADAKPRSARGWVRREALWGMFLASPLLFMVLTSAAQPGTPPLLAGLLLLAIGSFYAIPLLAMVGGRLPFLVRWLPALIAVFSTPLLLVGALLAGDEFLALILFVSAGGLGVAYAAGCMVAVRFARAVARRDAPGALERGGLPRGESATGLGWAALPEARRG